MKNKKNRLDIINLKNLRVIIMNQAMHKKLKNQ
jgi:hypothetical protein